MPHFYESRVIESKDGLQVKTYANEHPKGKIIVKPKYIPNTVFKCDEFQQRTLEGRPVNRFNVWVDKGKLKKYIETFKQHYPDYMHESKSFSNWFFCIPESKIAHAPDPIEGTKKLMAKDPSELDDYLRLTQETVNLLKDSGIISYNDIGLTNSTLLGTYTFGRSDVDLIVLGKEKYAAVIDHLKTIKNHPKFRPKSLEEWKKYYSTYNSGLNFNEKEFIWHAERKFIDTVYDGTVLSVFGVEKPNEIEVKWGDENYEPLGIVTVQGIVTDAKNGSVRPGYYEIKDSKILKGSEDVKVSKVVTYARDFLLQARPGETLQACGRLEKVTSGNKNIEPYYRVVVGYFDSYITDRRENEFLKTKIPNV
jgi:predicted nucleotidyltransferase